MFSWFKKKEKKKGFELRIYFNKRLDFNAWLLQLEFSKRAKVKAEFERIIKL